MVADNIEIFDTSKPFVHDVLKDSGMPRHEVETSSIRYIDRSILRYMQTFEKI